MPVSVPGSVVPKVTNTMSFSQKVKTVLQIVFSHCNTQFLCSNPSELLHMPTQQNSNDYLIKIINKNNYQFPNNKHMHTANLQQIIASSIDYRATYVNGIGNGCAPPIVLHWAALKYSPEYLALTKIN